MSTSSPHSDAASVQTEKRFKGSPMPRFSESAEYHSMISKYIPVGFHVQLAGPVIQQLRDDFHSHPYDPIGVPRHATLPTIFSTANREAELDSRLALPEEEEVFQEQVEDAEDVSERSLPSAVALDDTGLELYNSGKRDAAMMKLCVDYVLSVIDKEALSAWTALNGPSFRKRLVEAQPDHWTLDSSGLLTPSGPWRSLLRPTVFHIEPPIVRTRTESVIVILWWAYTLPINKCLADILELVRSPELDMMPFRQLLALRQVPLVQCQGLCTYVLGPPGGFDLDLLSDIRNGRKHWSEAHQVPEENPKYKGETTAPVQRDYSHREQSAEPVNHRVALLREFFACNEFELYQAFAVPDDTPVPVLHVLESIHISIFGFTQEERGGLNISAMDRCAWTQLWTRARVTRFFSVLTRVAKEAPLIGWPLSRDQPAWVQILDLIFPGDPPHVFGPDHLHQLLHGRARVHLTARKHDGVNKHWASSLNGLPRAMSQETQESCSGKVSTLVRNSGPKLFARLLQVIESVSNVEEPVEYVPTSSGSADVWDAHLNLFADKRAEYIKSVYTSAVSDAHKELEQELALSRRDSKMGEEIFRAREATKHFEERIQEATRKYNASIAQLDVEAT